MWNSRRLLSPHFGSQVATFSLPCVGADWLPHAYAGSGSLRLVGFLVSIVRAASVPVNQRRPYLDRYL